MTVAGIDEDAAVGGLRELRGKILPHGDGAEAFVEHDDGGSISQGRKQQSFEAFAVDVDVAVGLRQVGQRHAPDSESQQYPIFCGELVAGDRGLR